MRKLLDWIADKLGYQRKWKTRKWNLPAITQELLDDDCLPPGHFHNMMEGIFLQPTGTHETDPFIVKD